MWAVADFWHEELSRLDCSLVVTADHGHIDVPPSSMVTLPPPMVECLEYANIGVWGAGRHAYFHCRAGRQEAFARAWHAAPRLVGSFLLLRELGFSAKTMQYAFRLSYPVRMALLSFPEYFWMCTI